MGEPVMHWATQREDLTRVKSGIMDIETIVSAATAAEKVFF